MNEIKNKILELYELVKNIPDDCKGNSEEASINRIKYLHIRRMVYDLINE